jgi:hypothetical protein
MTETTRPELDIDPDELFTIVETSNDLTERNAAVVAIARVIKLADSKRDAIPQRDGAKNGEQFSFVFKLRDELATKLVLCTSFDCGARIKKRHRREARAWFQYWIDFLESD